MFSVKYQMFLNDIYYWGSTELLTYAMTKTYLEDIDFLLTTQKQIRFNQRMDRLYLDVDWGSLKVGDYILLEFDKKKYYLGYRTYQGWYGERNEMVERRKTFK